MNWNNFWDKCINLFDKKLVVSVIAEVSRGKSTFLNALIFQDDILEYKIGENTTNIFTINYKQNFDVLSQKRIVKDFNNEAVISFSKFNRGNFFIKLKIIIIKYLMEILNKNIYKKSLYFTNKEFENLTFIDTPGFNSINNAKIQKLINIALSKSDMVILVLDITKGITKEEIQQIKNIKKYGISKIMIVLNKKDLVDENIKEIDEFISQMKLKVKKYIDIHEPILALSAKGALVGFKIYNNDKVDDSNILRCKNEIFLYRINSRKWYVKILLKIKGLVK